MWTEAGSKSADENKNKRIRMVSYSKAISILIGCSDRNAVVIPRKGDKPKVKPKII